MATANVPAPTLQPIADEKNLLAPLTDSGASCCGGGACSVD